MKSSSISTTKTAEFRNGWPILLAATVGLFADVTTIPFYTLGSFITPLQTAFGWGRGDVASSFLYIMVVLALVSPIVGYIIDRVGVRTVALVSIPLLALDLFAISRIEGSVLEFHALYALAALAGAGATPITYSRAVNGVFDQARGLALGISLAGKGFAALTLPPLLAIMIPIYGWRAGYELLAFLTLLPWPFVLLCMKNTGSVKKRARVAPTSRRVALAAANPLRTGIFWGVSLPFALTALASAALVVHMTPLLHDAGMNAAAVARTTSIIGLGLLGGRLIVGYLIDRYFAPYVAVALTLGTAVGCLLLLYADLAFAPLAGILVGLSLGADVDIIAFLTSRYFGMSRYSFIYAIIYSTYAVGASVGPALAGIGFDATGSYTAVLWSAIGLLVVAAGAMMCLPRFEGSEERPRRAERLAVAEEA
jgi:MFS family permease